jgi:hypothetical protein
MNTKQSDKYGDQESEQRFQAALKGALNTPPKPLKSMARKRPETQSKKENKAKKKTAQTGI